MDTLLKENCDECEYFIEIENSLSLSHNITNEILSKKPLNRLLNEIIKSSKILLNAEASTLYLFNEANKKLHFHIVKGKSESTLSKQTIALGEGIAGWVAENREPLLIKDCYSDPRFDASYDKTTSFKSRNMLCVPMIKNKELIGVLQLINKKNKNNFSDIDLKFAKMLANQCAIAIENARLVEIEIKEKNLQFELDTARNIQQNLIPKNLPSIKNIDLAIKLIPAKEVGGDYFNVIKISEGKTLVFIIDVTGKSISAALIVSTIFSFIQTYLLLNKQKFNLIDFVESLNRFLISATTSDKFATAWFAVFDETKNSLESINAGHNPTYLIRNKSIIELSKGGIFLGSLEIPFQSEIINLQKDDTVIFYTDGITEAMNESEEEFGDDHFLDLIKNMNQPTSEDYINKILLEIEAHKKEAEQSDDITCGVIRIL